MGQEAIEIYTRLRPVFKPRTVASCFTIENDFDHGKIIYNIPKDVSQGIINNTRQYYEFRFNAVFGMDTKQDQIFDRVAKKCVLSALDGYNSTVFAYGQTGSGKTYTMTGGNTSYEDRGIIPRALALIFDEIAKRKDRQYNISINYIEIYNENCYDLLDPAHETAMQIEDIPKVSLSENKEGELIIEVAPVKVDTIDKAVEVLFEGAKHRYIAETSMNETSSRSHCVFIVHIESHKIGEETKIVSKLNLVDLAGSERVAKTNADGTILTQAKFINLSLHYLEQVIVSLSEGAGFVPYRNSTMTRLLKNSLGGNCKTTMIATINPDADHVDESISTCKFAMRVGSVKQTAVINERLDPDIVIRRLNREINELKDRLNMYEQGEREPLTPEEKELTKQRVLLYIDDPAYDAQLNLGGDYLRIVEAFSIFKNLVLEARRNAEGSSSSGGKQVPSKQQDGSVRSSTSSLSSATKGKAADGKSVAEDDIPANAKEIIKNQQQTIQQREQELNVMLKVIANMRAEAARRKGSEVSTQTDDSDLTADAAEQQPQSRTRSTPNGTNSHAQQGEQGGNSNNNNNNNRTNHTNPTTFAEEVLRRNREEVAKMLNPNINIDELFNSEKLRNRLTAFEVFKKSYRKSQEIENLKATLEIKTHEGKATGELLVNIRSKFEQLKKLVQQLRLERGMQGLINKAEGEGEVTDPEEIKVRAMIKHEKELYETNLAKLKNLKSEIEYIQNLLNQHSEAMRKDFEKWYSVVNKQQTTEDQLPPMSAGGAGVSGGYNVVPSFQQLQLPLQQRLSSATASNNSTLNSTSNNLMSSTTTSTSLRSSTSSMGGISSSSSSSSMQSFSTYQQQQQRASSTPSSQQQPRLTPRSSSAGSITVGMGLGATSLPYSSGVEEDMMRIIRARDSLLNAANRQQQQQQQQ